MNFKKGFFFYYDYFEILPDPSLDGISQWDAIRSGSDGKRTEFIYNLDDTVPATQGHAGIR
jgi:hypothetical protein